MENLPVRIVTRLRASGVEIIEVYERLTTEFLHRHFWHMGRLQPVDDKDRLLMQDAAAFSFNYLPSTELNIFGRNFMATYTPRYVTNRYCIVCRFPWG
jgi:hypothetical protein